MKFLIDNLAEFIPAAAASAALIIPVVLPVVLIIFWKKVKRKIPLTAVSAVLLPISGAEWYKLISDAKRYGGAESADYMRFCLAVCAANLAVTVLVLLPVGVVVFAVWTRKRKVSRGN